MIEKYGSVDSFENIFEKIIIWEIEHDLKMLVKKYQSLLEQKKTVILLSLKEAGKFPELDALINHIPLKYIQLLENYFATMMEKGKIKKADPFTVATNFAFINFGYFLMKTRMNPEQEKLSTNHFINNNIHFFINTLR